MKLVKMLAMLALVVAGCGSTDTETSPRASEPAPATVSTTPAPVRTSTPTPRLPKSVKAKDGTNLAACRDGNCQVIVLDRPVTIRFRGGRPLISGSLNIKSIDSDGVAYELVGDNFPGGAGAFVDWNTTTYGVDQTVLSGTQARSDDPAGFTGRAIYVGAGIAVIDLHVV
jgi:hypothetical protein